MAVLAGLKAEDVIEHGEAIHELMEQHERQALITMGIFTVVLVWKLYRRFQLAPIEDLVLRGLSVLGFVGLLYTATIGGKLAFEHAAGVPSATLKVELENREAGHHHAAGEADANAMATEVARMKRRTNAILLCSAAPARSVLTATTPRGKISAHATRRRSTNTNAQRGTRNAEQKGVPRCARPNLAVPRSHFRVPRLPSPRRLHPRHHPSSIFP